jgi:hypothetical protein
MLLIFAGSCYDCKSRLVLQCRVQVTRTRGKHWSHESYAAKVSILLIEKYYFHIWWIAKYILFYKPEPIVCWLWSVLDDLSTFEYIEIMMMFWSMNMICGVWMNGVTICYVCEFWKLWLHWTMNVILEWVWSLGTWCITCHKSTAWLLTFHKSTTWLLTCHKSTTLSHDSWYSHMHTYIVMWWNVLHVSYIVVLLNVLVAWFKKHWVWMCLDVHNVQRLECYVLV